MRFNCIGIASHKLFSFPAVCRYDERRNLGFSISAFLQFCIQHHFRKEP